MSTDLTNHRDFVSLLDQLNVDLDELREREVGATSLALHLGNLRNISTGLRDVVALDIPYADITLEEYKDNWRALIHKWREERYRLGAPTEIGRMDAKVEDRTNINGVVMMAYLWDEEAMGKPFVMRITRYDNTAVTVDRETMIRVGLQIGAYIGEIHNIGQTLKEAVDAAVTKEQVMAITWPEELPSPV